MNRSALRHRLFIAVLIGRLSLTAVQGCLCKPRHSAMRTWTLGRAPSTNGCSPSTAMWMCWCRELHPNTGPDSRIGPIWISYSGGASTRSHSRSLSGRARERRRASRRHAPKRTRNWQSSNVSSMTIRQRRRSPSLPPISARSMPRQDCRHRKLSERPLLGKEPRRLDCLPGGSAVVRLRTCRQQRLRRFFAAHRRAGAGVPWSITARQAGGGETQHAGGNHRRLAADGGTACCRHSRSRRRPSSPAIPRTCTRGQHAQLERSELDAIKANGGVGYKSPHQYLPRAAAADYHEKLRALRAQYGLSADFPEGALGFIQGAEALSAERHQASYADWERSTRRHRSRIMWIISTTS